MKLSTFLMYENFNTISSIMTKKKILGQINLIKFLINKKEEKLIIGTTKKSVILKQNGRFFKKKLLTNQQL